MNTHSLVFLKRVLRKTLFSLHKWRLVCLQNYFAEIRPHSIMACQMQSSFKNNVFSYHVRNEKKWRCLCWDIKKGATGYKVFFSQVNCLVLKRRRFFFASFSSNLMNLFMDFCSLILVYLLLLLLLLLFSRP